ncbi:UNVERIFIED_CONTAM: hypothetical protein RMT77_016668 [Armadillidium vulgare]
MDSYDPNIECEYISKISDAPSEELLNTKKLITKRGSKLSACTKQINIIYSKFTTLSCEEKLTYIFVLKKFKLELEQLDELISDAFLICSEYSFSKHEEIEKKNIDYQFNIGALISKLESSLSAMSSLGTLGTQAQSPQNMTPIGGSNSHINFPPIELPKFSSQPEDLDQFLFAFDNIMSKRNFSSFEKYRYLVKQVQGPAKAYIEEMKVEDQNYEVAKNLLIKAYSSKVGKQFSVIEKIAKLKLLKDSKMLEWVSEVRVLKDQIASLGID